MALTDSEPNFRARCKMNSLADAVTSALCTSGINTIAKFAFSSSFVPGMQDETPFKQAMEAAIGREPTVGEFAVLRKLLHECYAMTAAELKSTIRRVEDQPVKRLAQPERADRLKRQQARLTGLNIAGKLEPSDRLIDRFAHMYEENRLSYVELAECTSKEQEVLNASQKEDRFMVIDTAGGVKLKEKETKLEADVSTDLMIRMALMRRGLAMDQCNLLDYKVHDRWVEKVFDTRTDLPIEGFSAVTLSQVIQADRKLFLKLAELTRDGIQVTATGKPLDAAFPNAMQHPDVLHVLQPVPLAKVIRTEKDDAHRTFGSHEFGKGLRGSKGKNKGKGSTTIRMPAGLDGGVPATKQGNPICFDFNFQKCRLPVSKGRCRKGLHICCFKGCHKANHCYQNCPNKNTS